MEGVFVYLEGRAEIYIQISELIRQRSNSSQTLFMGFNKKRCPFLSSAYLIWSPDWRPRPGFLIPLGVAISAPAATDFLINHLVQIPIASPQLTHEEDVCQPANKGWGIKRALIYRAPFCFYTLK